MLIISHSNHFIQPLYSTPFAMFCSSELDPPPKRNGL